MIDQQFLQTLIEATVERAIDRVRVPTFRPATVLSADAPATPFVLIDGDSDGTFVQSLVSVVTPGQRVMVVFYPPSGALIVGIIDPPDTDAALDARLDAAEAAIDAAEADIVQLQTAKCQITHSTTQNLANNVGAFAATFDTEQYDPQGWHSAGNPTRITPNVLGLYKATALLEWSARSDYTRRLIDVNLNGAAISNPIHRAETVNVGNLASPVSLVTPLILLDGIDDYVELRVYQTNTAAATVTIRPILLLELEVPL